MSYVLEGETENGLWRMLKIIDDLDLDLEKWGVLRWRQFSCLSPQISRQAHI